MMFTITPGASGQVTNVALPAALLSPSFMMWLRSLSTGSLCMRLMALVVWGSGLPLWRPRCSSCKGRGVGTGVAASPPAPDERSTADPADVSRNIRG
jgi:hypothetical protein